MGSDFLDSKIEREFGAYLELVLLKLEQNSAEDESSILAILRRNDVNYESLRKFVQKQSSVVRVLSQVPESLHAMLFEARKIDPTWANCLAFLNGGGLDERCLVAYLDDSAVRTTLMERPIPTDPSSQPLWNFLLNAAGLSNSAYADYIDALPISFTRFPETTERSKRKVLITQRKVTLTKASLEDLDDDAELQVLFVATNIQSYIDDPDILELHDDFLESVLKRDVGDENKAAVIGFMNLNAVVDLPERAALFGPILDRTRSSFADMDADIVKSLIANSSPITTQISILNKANSLLSDADVRHILENLPPPYSEIKTGYYTPRLSDNLENRTLLSLLDSRNIISSWKVNDGFWTHDLKVNLYRR
jgi:hypothetical protein